MAVEIRFSPGFVKRIGRLKRRFPSVLEDLQALLYELETERETGSRVRGVGRPVFKVRLTNVSANRGKRGGFRALCALEDADTYIFFHIYSKTEANDVSAGRIRDLPKSLEQLQLTFCIL